MTLFRDSYLEQMIKLAFINTKDLSWTSSSHLYFLYLVEHFCWIGNNVYVFAPMPSLYSEFIASVVKVVSQACSRSSRSLLHSALCLNSTKAVVVVLFSLEVQTCIVLSVACCETWIKLWLPRETAWGMNNVQLYPLWVCLGHVQTERETNPSKLLIIFHKHDRDFKGYISLMVLWNLSSGLWFCM